MPAVGAPRRGQREASHAGIWGRRPPSHHLNYPTLAKDFRKISGSAAEDFRKKTGHELTIPENDRPDPVS